jgi:hypothetical protein
MPGVPDSEIERHKYLRARTAIATALDRLHRDSTFRRRALLRTIGIAVGVTTLIAVILTVVALTSPGNAADRLAAAGDVLVGATLLLAVIAALVALLAYAVSTGPPNLQLSVQFSGLTSNTFRTIGEDPSKDGLIKLRVSLPGRVLLRNQSSYSAKNPAFIVRLHALAFSGIGGFDKWTVIDMVDSSTAGWRYPLYTTIQWDGGPTYSIHGHSVRRLPNLDFTDLLHSSRWGPPSVTFEILAEGYRKEISCPVEILMDDKSLYGPQEKINPEWM